MSGTKLPHIDVNNPNFYHTLQDEIDSDLARLKKSVVIVKNLRSTDYVSHYRFDYPVAYIHPGVKEVQQPLYCTNPPAVAIASTIVCDWAAPPQVQFTLGDDYMHVVRQDPTGRFAGNAVIWTYTSYAATTICYRNPIRQRN